MQLNMVQMQLQKSEESLVMALRDYVKAAVSAHLHEVNVGVQGAAVSAPTVTMATSQPKVSVGGASLGAQASINDSLRSLESLLSNSGGDGAQSQIIADIQAMNSRFSSMSQQQPSDTVKSTQPILAAQTSAMQNDTSWFSSLSGWMKKVREG